MLMGEAFAGLADCPQASNQILVNDLEVLAAAQTASSIFRFRGRAISRQCVDATASIMIKVIALDF
jgi:hypothetical protein